MYVRLVRVRVRLSFFRFASSGFAARDDVVFVSCVILWEKVVLLLLCFINFFLWRLGNIFLGV